MSESETDRKLHPDLHPLLLRFQELTGEPLESVWRVYDHHDLDTVILVFPRVALILQAEPNDDTIKVDLANREDLHSNEWSEASSFEPWSNCVGKHFSWGWLTINHFDAIDGIMLAFSENTPQVLLTVVASCIKESVVSLLTNHPAEEPEPERDSSAKLNVSMVTHYQCCFCGQTIETLSPDVGGLLYTTSIDRSPEEQHEQQLWCHARCLKQHLHPSVPLYVLDL